MANANTYERAKKLSIGGALLAAFAASSCCIGPLLLMTLGVGGVGATAALGIYRPYLLAATALLLCGGFYYTYRTPRLAAGNACVCERPRANRAGRLGLWVATAIVILVAAAPPLLTRWADAHRPGRGMATDTNLAKTTIEVRGIDCEACAGPLRRVLTKVGGFRDLELDVPKQAITVTYEPALGRLAAYVTAINDLGYEAKLPDRSGAP